MPSVSSLKIDDPLVKKFIENKVNKDAYKVISAIKRGKTDEQIAKSPGLKVNTIRNLLNRLHYIGVIHYTKEKAKNSNWYTYTWFLRKERLAELLEEEYREELQRLEEKISFEKNYVFFSCGNKCTKLPFELAFEYDFKCPECGSTMEEMDNEKELKKIERKIRQIRKLLYSK